MEEELQFERRNKVKAILDIAKNTNYFKKNNQFINLYFQRLVSNSSYEELVHNVFEYSKNFDTPLYENVNSSKLTELFVSQIGRIYPVNSFYIQDKEKSLIFQKELTTVLKQLNITIPEYHLKMLEKINNTVLNNLTLTVAQNKELALLSSIENVLIDIKEKLIHLYKENGNGSVLGLCK